jgi:hypothetical protein
VLLFVAAEIYKRKGFGFRLRSRSKGSDVQ